MIQGSNQARTARSATGQQSRGRRGSVPLIFPPPDLAGGGRGSGGRRGRSAGTADRLDRHRSERRVLLTEGVPTKGEGTADQRPMPADRQIGAHLIVAPTQGV